MKNTQNYIERVLDNAWVATAGFASTQGTLYLFAVIFFALLFLLLKYHLSKKMVSHIYMLSKKKKIKSLSYLGLKIEFEETTPKENSS
ncbi:MAG: hypothetical protein ABIP51_18240 [Bacteroidia bacterium]